MFKRNQKLLFLFIGLFLVFSFLLAGCDKKQPVISDNNNANNVSDNNNTTQNNNNVNNGNNNNQQNNNQNNQVDEYKSWKTYRNEEYGFEVKYPKEFVFEEANKSQKKISGEIVSFMNEDILKQSQNKKYFGPLVDLRVSHWEDINNEQAITGFVSSVHENTVFKNLKEAIESNKIFKVKTGELTINNENFYEVSLSHGEGINYGLMIEKDGIYEFSFNKAEKKENLDEIYKNILSSIRFNQEAKHKDWTTYRNEEYGFEVKYPKDWKEENLPFDKKGVSLFTNDSEGTRQGINVEYYEKIENASRKNINIPKNLDEYMQDPMFKDAEKIDFNGNEAFTAKVENKVINYEGTNIVIQKSGHIYVISYSKDSDLKQKVISSFKFKDWQTYRNKEYGFEFLFTGDLDKLEVESKKVPKEKSVYDSSDHNILYFNYQLDEPVKRVKNDPSMGMIKTMMVWYLEIIPINDWKKDACKDVPLCRQGDILAKSDKYVFQSGFRSIEGAGYLCQEQREKQNKFCKVEESFYELLNNQGIMFKVVN